MDNDLISRKGLKDHKFLAPDNPNVLKYYPDTVSEYQKGWNDAIDAIIKNAPAVTSDPSQVNSQSTGMWDFEKELWGKYFFTCTKCHVEEDVPTSLGRPLYKFCPNCGSKMVQHRS